MVSIGLLSTNGLSMLQGGQNYRSYTSAAGFHSFSSLMVLCGLPSCVHVAEQASGKNVCVLHDLFVVP